MSTGSGLVHTPNMMSYSGGCNGGGLVYPQIVSTDLNDLICKMNLVVGAPGVAAQRMTSVAWKRSAGGMVRPRASAVLRLRTSSNPVGCSTGRSAGLVPFKIRST
jgi:hypothetical protein